MHSGKPRQKSVDSEKQISGNEALSKMLLLPTPSRFLIMQLILSSQKPADKQDGVLCIYFSPEQTSCQRSGLIQAIKSSFLGTVPAPSYDWLLDRLIMGDLSPGVTSESP